MLIVNCELNHDLYFQRVDVMLLLLLCYDERWLFIQLKLAESMIITI